MAPFHSTRYKSHRDWTHVFVYWNCLIPISQVWGIFTSVILLGIGVHQLFSHNALLGVNIILASCGVFCLESSWLLTKFLGKDVPDSIKCCQLMSGLQDPWNLWKKALVYWMWSLLLFMTSRVTWMYQASGIQLIVLSALYLLMFIQHELRVHILEIGTNRGASQFFRAISQSLREGEEMEVFEKIPENPEFVESAQEEDPALLRIISVDEDPMLTM